MTPVVYRCFDAEGRLLYIGSSRNFRVRMRDHRKYAVWHHLMARVETEEYPSITDARQAEANAIRTESPHFNKDFRSGVAAVDLERHGTVTSYNKGRCRCDECRAAWRAYSVSWLARQRAVGLAPDDPRHGKHTTYFSLRCRCDECKQAAAVHRRKYRKYRKAA